MYVAIDSGVVIATVRIYHVVHRAHLRWKLKLLKTEGMVGGCAPDWRPGFDHIKV